MCKNVEQLKSYIQDLEGSYSDIVDGISTQDVDKYKPFLEAYASSDNAKLAGITNCNMLQYLKTVKKGMSKGKYTQSMGNEVKVPDDYYTRSGVSSKLQENLETLTKSRGEESIIDESSNLRLNTWGLCENFSTDSMAPYPVPNLNLVTYAYTGSVVPLMSNLFDLKSKKGLVYYEKLVARSTKGDVSDGDNLGSPRELGTQASAFALNRQIEKKVGEIQSGEQEPSGVIGTGTPIQKDLIVKIPELDQNAFWEFDLGGASTQIKNSVNGTLGRLTVNFDTGAYEFELIPTITDTYDIKATFAPRVELDSAAEANNAEYEWTLESTEVTTEDVRLKTRITLHQENLTRAIYGIDVNDRLNMHNEALYNKELANKVIKEIQSKIPGGSIHTYDISNGIAEGGNNALFNTVYAEYVLNTLPARISKASGIPVTKLACYACDISTVPFFRTLNKFKPLPVFESAMGGAHVIGTYDGVPVIVFHAEVLGEGQIIGLFKSKRQEFLCPHVTGQLMLPTIRRALDYNNLSTGHVQLSASIGTKTVAPNLAAQLSISNLDQIGLGV